MAASAIIAFLPSESAQGYEPPLPLQECFDGPSGPQMFEHEQLFKHKKRGLFKDSFVHECSPDVWSGEASRDLARLIDILRQKKQPAWVPECGLLVARQHGDLNFGNVLVDMRDTLWLIDLANSSDAANPFTDAMKMVSSLLFEHVPCRSRRRVQTATTAIDAFGLSERAAEWLVERSKRCATPADLGAAFDEDGGGVTPDNETQCSPTLRARKRRTHVREAFELIDDLWKSARCGRWRLQSLGTAVHSTSSSSNYAPSDAVLVEDRRAMQGRDADLHTAHAMVPRSSAHFAL